MWRTCVQGVDITWSLRIMPFVCLVFVCVGRRSKYTISLTKHTNVYTSNIRHKRKLTDTLCHPLLLCNLYNLTTYFRGRKYCHILGHLHKTFLVVIYTTFHFLSTIILLLSLILLYNMSKYKRWFEIAI